MPRISLSKQAADCFQRIADLQTQIENLSLDNRRKRFENKLLSTCCEALLWLRQQQLNSDEQWPSAEAEDPNKRLALLDELLASVEVGLDRASHDADHCCSVANEAISRPTWAPINVTSHPISSTSSRTQGPGTVESPPSSSAEPLAHLSQPLAPPDDLLWVLRHLACNPPDVEDMTLQQLQQSYISKIQQMAVLLNVWNNPHGVANSAQHPAQQLWDMFFGHWRLVYALCVSPCLNGFPKVNQFHWSNAVTGEVYLPNPHKDVCLHVIEQLQLTDEQQEQITWGYSVLHSMTAPLIHTIVQLEKELGAAAVRSADKLFAAVSLPAGLQAHNSCDQAQNKQLQQLYKQMQVTMKKGVLVELIIACFVIGRMTYTKDGWCCGGAGVLCFYQHLY
eukprot:gene2598-2900_t